MNRNSVAALKSGEPVACGICQSEVRVTTVLAQTTRSPFRRTPSGKQGERSVGRQESVPGPSHRGRCPPGRTTGIRPDAGGRHPANRSVHAPATRRVRRDPGPNAACRGAQSVHRGRARQRTWAEPEPAPSPPASKPQNGAAKKKLRTPQLVSGLEFTSGRKPLTDYVKEIDPKEHSKRYLAIVFWLRQYRDISEVSGDHIYTCYRALGLNVPKDVGSVLRALKSQEWLERGSKDGLYKITHIGENQLTKACE